MNQRSLQRGQIKDDDPMLLRKSDRGNNDKFSISAVDKNEWVYVWLLLHYDNDTNSGYATLKR